MLDIVDGKEQDPGRLCVSRVFDDSTGALPPDTRSAHTPPT